MKQKKMQEQGFSHELKDRHASDDGYLPEAHSHIKTPVLGKQMVASGVGTDREHSELDYDHTSQHSRFKDPLMVNVKAAEGRNEMASNQARHSRNPIISPYGMEANANTT